MENDETEVKIQKTMKSYNEMSSKCSDLIVLKSLPKNEKRCNSRLDVYKTIYGNGLVSKTHESKTRAWWEFASNFKHDWKSQR